MTRLLPFTSTGLQVECLAEEQPTRDMSRALLGTGHHLRMTLNHKLGLYAARVMCEALDNQDYEVVTIIEYALYGASSSSITMADIADRLIALQGHAKKLRDKKMLLVLKAAAVNAAG